MSSDGIYIALRVGITCLVFAFFVFVPLKSRYRYDSRRTGMLAGFLVAATIVFTIIFFVPGQFLSAYNIPAIFGWICLAVVVFRLTIKGTFFELLFIVLVVLNLYVNIMAITKAVVTTAKLEMTEMEAQLLLAAAILVLYTPLLYILMMRFYRQVIEIDIYLSFWRIIWIIPALTYVIFYVKVVNDYWGSPTHIEGKDVVFSILWSFSTYVFFLVTLVMLIQEYKGIVAAQKASLAVSQLQMQEEQYDRLIENIENTARLRHDWRHHLLIINGFSESGNVNGLREYMQELMPEYLTESEVSFCENHVVDVILKHYSALAKEQGIVMKIHANLPAYLDVSETDMGTVFGNLVENAVQACKGQNTKERIIEIRAVMKNSQIVVMIKNTYNNKIVEKNGVYLSTKHEGAGRGISSVRRVVEKYHGVINIKYDDEFFNLNLFMNQIHKGE